MLMGSAARPNVAAVRDGLDKRDRAPARFLNCLLALLFAVQIAGWHAPARAGVAPQDAKAIALANLGAVVHQPVVLCEHGTPSGPRDPADPSPCEHCVFCHAVAVGLAPQPIVAPVAARPATSAAITRSREDVAFVRARHAGGASPRGPPIVG